MTTKINELKTALFAHKEVLICSHIRPDGDTIGATLALREVLLTKGILVDIVCDSSIPQKFSYLSEVKEYKRVEEITKQYPLVVFVDTASDGQMGECYKIFYSHKNVINIDHHVSNKGYAKYNYVVNKASCCEVLADMFKEMGIEITQNIAKFLLLGMVTDTGNFAHNNTTANTLKVASEMVEKGANLVEINLQMFKNQPMSRSKLYLEIMSKSQYFHEDRVAVIIIRQQDLQKYGLDNSVTEGFIDYNLTISSVVISVSILETKDKTYKVSFRSKGEIDVNRVAGTFGGGGHKNASGAMLRGYLEDVVDKLVFTCGQYLD
ncbi:MAG: bifunctional oligoribonuclease/PAP phosphatase NrnA [Clostridia bacterium]|nr:bifunctional oligoribonuclease/PAP phosphatase NrnA [Clostridia bacterium]